MRLRTEATAGGSALRTVRTGKKGVTPHIAMGRSVWGGRGGEGFVRGAGFARGGGMGGRWGVGKDTASHP